MKRDMDLVRKILIFMSGNERGPHVKWQEELPEYTREQILHHAHLMAQGGLIEAAHCDDMDDLLPMALPTSITWAGHDFLAAASDDTIWAQAKKTVLAPAAGATFTVVLEWMKIEAMRRLGLA